MSKDCEDVTVHSMYPAHEEGPVFYCSLSHATETCRHLLICTLWEHLLAMKSPLWNYCQASHGDTFPLQVASGSLGRPYLLVGESRGPAISFSEGGGKVWAALSGDESDIGIDVAGPEEFPRDYPVHRVFHPEELQHALRLTGGDLATACSLLWSIKEAAVKALGCAFHLVEPRQIKVYPPAEETPGRDGWYAFPVGLSAKTQVRFPPSADRPLWVRSRPLSKVWLSIAYLKRRPAVHE